jgi:hypothetical protein
VFAFSSALNSTAILLTPAADLPDDTFIAKSLHKDSLVSDSLKLHPNFSYFYPFFTHRLWRQ